MLVSARQVIPVQTVSGGQLSAFRLRPGGRVRKGEVVARLDETELRQRIEADRRLLSQLQTQDEIQRSAETQQFLLQSQQDTLDRRAIELDRRSAERSLANAEAIEAALKRRQETLQELVAAKLLAPAAPELIDARRTSSDNDARIWDSRARLDQMEGRLQQVDLRMAALRKQALEASLARRRQIAEVETRIAEGNFRLKQYGDVISPADGRISEVYAAEGQVLAAGARLFTLETGPASGGLTSITYWPVKDGKKIRPGMMIQVTPEGVDRSRFGGITGRVMSVSPLAVTHEGAAAKLGNADLVQDLLGSGTYLEVTSQLDPDASSADGYHWSLSHGPEHGVTPGMTTTARVTVESLRPVSFVIPALRQQSGLD